MAGIFNQAIFNDDIFNTDQVIVVEGPPTNNAGVAFTRYKRYVQGVHSDKWNNVKILINLGAKSIDTVVSVLSRLNAEHVQVILVKDRLQSESKNKVSVGIPKITALQDMVNVGLQKLNTLHKTDNGDLKEHMFGISKNETRIIKKEEIDRTRTNIVILMRCIAKSKLAINVISAYDVVDSIEAIEIG